MMRRLVLGLLVTSACDGEVYVHDARVTDARVDADSSMIFDAATVTCTCCTQRAFEAADAFDVASAGELYVTYQPSVGVAHELGIVSETGGPPTTIATAQEFRLATFGSALFYAARTNMTYELHERVGTTDTVLGTVTSDALRIAANATDLYVLANENSVSTLRRFPRAGGASQIVTTFSSGASSLYLGDTFALVGNQMVPLSGAPVSEVEPFGGQVEVSGDQVFVLGWMLQTSHAGKYWIDRVLPTMLRIKEPTTIIGGGYSNLRADTTRLYWRATSGSLQPGSVTTQSLLSVRLDGTGETSLCNAWPSTVLQQDATHLLGLEQQGALWFVDMLAKP